MDALLVELLQRFLRLFVLVLGRLEQPLLDRIEVDDVKGQLAARDRCELSDLVRDVPLKGLQLVRHLRRGADVELEVDGGVEVAEDAPGRRAHGEQTLLGEIDSTQRATADYDIDQDHRDKRQHATGRQAATLCRAGDAADRQDVEQQEATRHKEEVEQRAEVDDPARELFEMLGDGDVVAQR